MDEGNVRLLEGSIAPIRTTSPIVTFLVPALNEESNLPPLFERLLGVQEAIGLPCEILVVDDASEDATRRVGEAASEIHPQIRVLSKPLPRGVGRAVRFGLLHARGKVVVVVMADGVDPLESAVPEFCRLVLHDGCRLVLLSRYSDAGDAASIPASYRMFHALFRLATVRLIGLPYRDTTYAFRAFDVEFVRGIGLRSDGFEISPEITFRTFFAGGKIGEVAGRQTRRVRGASNFRFAGVARGYARVLLQGIGMRLGLAPRPAAGDEEPSST